VDLSFESSIAEKMEKESRMSSQVDEWTLFWVGSDGKMLWDELMRHIDGRKSQTRSLWWRIAAGMLPMRMELGDVLRDWPEVSFFLREDYIKLKESVVVHPDDHAGMFDPLSAGANDFSGRDEGNPWREFHRDQQLLEEIQTDLERLFPTGVGDFFANPVASEPLKNVLFTWSKLHKDTSYRQGMHELAAPLLYTLWIDCENCKEERSKSFESEREKAIQSCFEKVLDKSFLEADLFFLFERIMRDLEPMFRVGRLRMTEKEIKGAKQDLKRRNIQGRELELFTESTSKDTELAPVLKLCNRIQGELLQQVDGVLSTHLETLGIEPQMYGLRWIRLMFVREFPMSQLLSLWDAILPEGFDMESRIGSNDESFDPSKICAHCRNERKQNDSERKLTLTIAYFAVSMLLQIRESIISNDFSGSLGTLLHFPRIENPLELVKMALSLKRSPNGGKAMSISPSKQDEQIQGKAITKQQGPPMQQAKAHLSFFLKEVGDRFETISAHREQSMTVKERKVREEIMKSARNLEAIAARVNDGEIKTALEQESSNLERVGEILER